MRDLNYNIRPLPDTIINREIYKDYEFKVDLGNGYFVVPPEEYTYKQKNKWFHYYDEDVKKDVREQMASKRSS